MGTADPLSARERQEREVSAPVRVWYNRNVSGTYHLAPLLCGNPAELAVEIVGSYPREDHLMLQACDFTALEPVIADGAEYVDWAVDFAQQHRIDVLVPGEGHQAELAAAADRFATVGTLVQSCSATTIELMADKAQTYRRAATLGFPVPLFEVVSTGGELRSSYDRIMASGERVTMKPVQGFGASGFWKLTEDVPELADLLGAPSPYLNVDAACAILDRAHADGQVVAPWIVSQYLASPEDSVDVLADGTNMLAGVIRRKPSLGQTRSFPADPELMELTEALVEAFGLAYLCNVQWRRSQGRPMLLEVNTRAAAGLFQSCAQGINFPYLALRLRLGLPVEVPARSTGAADQVVFSAAVVMHPLVSVEAPAPGRTAVELPGVWRCS